VEQGSVLTAPTLVDADGPVLVVIGGLPGSGKTTLLRRLLAEPVPSVTGLDSEFVAEQFRRAGIGVPYRFLRPWVHLVHRQRVLWAVRGGDPVVVLTDPWTGGRWRAAVLGAAAAAGRRLRLVHLQTDPVLAVEGQSARGRVLPERAMRRHVERSSRLAGAQDALVLDRSGADRLTLAQILSRARACTPRARAAPADGMCAAIPSDCSQAAVGARQHEAATITGPG
jgi:predicted kinase